MPVSYWAQQTGIGVYPAFLKKFFYKKNDGAFVHGANIMVCVGDGGGFFFGGGGGRTFGMYIKFCAKKYALGNKCGGFFIMIKIILL